MALPTSTIVMALLTAVPFGLAIKDTINGTPTFDTRSDETREADEATASMERAQHEYEEQQQKQKVELQTAIEKLIPMTTKAILGLPGYQLNREVPGTSPADQERLEEVAHAVITPNLQPDGRLKELWISFPQYRSDENICLLVSERLEEAWGTSSRTYAAGRSRKHFAANSLKQRVTFTDPDESDRCELVLEELVAVPDFANMTETSIVPLWAIGKPAAKLVAHLGNDAFSDDMQIRWTRPGVGEGVGETVLFARVVKGKIVTITAKFQTTASTFEALRDKWSADFGEPTESDSLVWKKAKLSLATLDETAGDYLLTAGAPLPTADEE